MDPSQEPTLEPGRHPGQDADGAGHPADPNGPDEVGSVSEEAERLYAALGDWARGLGDLGAHGNDGDHGAHGDDGDHGSHGSHGSSCAWCPLCRTLDVVRSASPEVRTQLGVAATALLRAGAGFLAGLDDGRARDGAPEPDQQDGPHEQDEHDEHDEHDDGWEA